MSKKITYESSGVSIDTGNELISKLKNIIKPTFNQGVISNIGGFGALFDIQKFNFKNPILVSGADGVGTKLKIAIKLANHKNIGIDLVAMCVNDLVAQGAMPLFFLDYFATGKLDLSQAEEVITSIAKGCKIAKCALIGGETAEMPGVYHDNVYDLAGFAVGAVERENILPKRDLIKEGDIILGISSNGIHSNGFSLVRKLLESEQLNYHDYFPFNKDITVGELLLRPTYIYSNICLELCKLVEIKAFAHITGGGISENLPRILPKNVQATINIDSWQRGELFKWCKNVSGLSINEILRVLNCGVGMILITDKKNRNIILNNSINMDSCKIYEIGSIENREKNMEQVIYLNQDKF